LRFIETETSRLFIGDERPKIGSNPSYKDCVENNFIRDKVAGEITPYSEANGARSDTRRRSWPREQKLGAVKYALSKVVVNKAGKEELISNNAAATNIGCTPKMLRDWIRDYDTINASAKGCRKSRPKVSAKEPQMEQELHELFLQKRAIGRKIGSRWFFQNAQLIYGRIYPQRAEGKHTTYTGFGFSRGWFEGFLKRRSISLRVSLFSIQFCRNLTSF
jgi:transposase-like protein